MGQQEVDEDLLVGAGRSVTGGISNINAQQPSPSTSTPCRASSSSGDNDAVLEYLNTLHQNQGEQRRRQQQCHQGEDGGGKKEEGDLEPDNLVLPKDEVQELVAFEDELALKFNADGMGSMGIPVPPVRDLDSADNRDTTRYEDLPLPVSLERQTARSMRAVHPGAVSCVGRASIDAAEGEAGGASSATAILDEENERMTHTITTAHLVDEDQATQEINRLKRELAVLKEENHHQRHANIEAIVVAEPLSRHQHQDRQNIAADYAAFPFVSESYCLENEMQPKTTTTKKLPFDSVVLHGRDNESITLQEAFWTLLAVPEVSSPISSSPALTPSSPSGVVSRQLVQISGGSGAGKSVLALEAKKLVVSSNQGCYLSGKIDEANNEPYAAIGAACERLCEDLLLQKKNSNSSSSNNNDDNGTPEVLPPVGLNFGYDAFTAKMDRMLNDSDEMELLTTIIPSWHKIIGTEKADTSPGRNNSDNYLEVRHRFQYAFKQFVQLLCSFGPLVLVLDDVQWIDQSSLDLISCLLTELEEDTPLMLITTYRDNDVDDGHIFAKAVQQLKELTINPNLAFADIHLGSLTEDNVCGLLQSLLASEKSKIQDLASCVHSKTAGNPFYIKQFLLSLQSDGLLTRSLASNSWSYNIKELKVAATATDNVVSLLTEKLQKLSPIMRSMLPRIAFLGASFSFKSAQIVLDHHASSYDIPGGNAQICASMLSVLIQEGLLVDCGHGWCKWEHDKVKEAALLFIKNEDLNATRYEIGELLLNKISRDELSSSLFAITDLMNPHAGSLAQDNPRRAELLELNLQSGKTAFKASAFGPAASYLKQGISLLPQNNWATHFDASLELYSSAAEAQYSIGNFIQSKKYCDEVLSLDSCSLIKRRRVVSSSFACFSLDLSRTNELTNFLT